MMKNLNQFSSTAAGEPNIAVYILKSILLLCITVEVCRGQDSDSLDTCALLLDSGTLSCSEYQPPESYSSKIQIIEQCSISRYNECKQFLELEEIRHGYIRKKDIPYYNDKMSHKCYYSLCYGNIICIECKRSYESKKNGYQYVRDRKQYFRDICNKTSIHLSGKGITKIESNATSCIKHIEDFDLSKNKIILENDTFEELSNLQSLKLSHNSIEILINNTFRGLESLKKLFLDSNNIQNLTEDVFRDLRSLQYLYLQENKLNDLGNNTLSLLPSLKYLNLANNNLERLENNFSKNPILNVLDLSNNANLVLEHDSFAGLHNLKKLFMYGCGIASLPVHIFQDMSRLIHLNMNYNHLVEISFDTFGALESLYDLHVAFNNISVLRDKPFRNIRNLTEIDLARNNLVEIKDLDFEGLNSIKVLNISSNSIKSFSSSILEAMPLIETLIMKQNQINHLFTFKNNTNLKVIDVSHNQLVDFRLIELERLPLLKKFWANDNNIQNLSIPLALQDCYDEKPEIHLERNKVKRIILMSRNISLTNCDKDVLIYLKENSLACDCQIYDLYRHLKDNTLQNVKFVEDITCHDNPSSQSTVLMKLNADAFICNIKVSCPKNCKCYYKAIDKVGIVDCKNSNYTNLPLQAPPGTQILYIGHNRLTSLACLDEPQWENLTEIHAEGNKITYDEFPLPRHLKFLGLRDNQIDTLPEVIKAHTKTSKYFKTTLSNGFWKCDCWILHLKAFLSNYENQVDDVYNLKCIFSNGTVSEVGLINMLERDLCPDVLRYVIIMGFSLFILCMLIFRYRYRLRINEVLNNGHHHYMRMLCCVKVEWNTKPFDCFLSYCSKDKDVVTAILREMGKSPPRYTFCTHERNWAVGCHATNNPHFSIENSRSVVMILSEAFFNSGWFDQEFYEAFQRLKKDKKFKLILILVSDIPDKSRLHVNVQYLLSLGIHLQFGEKWFWHKLRDAFRSLDKPLKLNIPDTSG